MFICLQAYLLPPSMEDFETIYKAFPAEPKSCIFSATTAFMASFAAVMAWMRSFFVLLNESM